MMLSALSAFMMLSNHLHHPSPERFHLPKAKMSPLATHPLSIPPSQPWHRHPPFCLCGLDSSRTSCKWSRVVLVLLRLLVSPSSVLHVHPAVAGFPSTFSSVSAFLPLKAPGDIRLYDRPHCAYLLILFLPFGFRVFQIKTLKRECGAMRQF